MVERIEQLGSELNVDFLADLSVLEDTEIELIQYRTSFAVSCEVAKRIARVFGRSREVQDKPHIVWAHRYQRTGTVKGIQ